MLEALAGSGLGILVLGLLIGMQHALEADHVAAVSSIAARKSTVRKIVTHGAVWGIGHTITLMIVAGGALLFGFVMDDVLAGWLELIVGVMLVALGGNLIFLLARERIHFHRHRHDDGTTHLHAHSHRDETQPHSNAAHEHNHPRTLPVRTLLIGMMHGLAGSAALVVLTAATVNSAPLGLGYILLFGVGSVLGMAALSALIAIPLTWSARAMTWANGGLQGTIGVATVVLGVLVVMESSAAISG